MKYILFMCLITYIFRAEGQSYEDKRCKCVCPSLSILTNSSGFHSDRKLYIANVPPNKCNCDGVILPVLGKELDGRAQEYCPRCECKYENRNTTVIKVTVILVISTIVALVAYKSFLICLYPLRRRRRSSYEKHNKEEARSLLSMD